MITRWLVRGFVVNSRQVEDRFSLNLVQMLNICTNLIRNHGQSSLVKSAVATLQDIKRSSLWQHDTYGYRE